MRVSLAVSLLVALVGITSIEGRGVATSSATKSVRQQHPQLHQQQVRALVLSILFTLALVALVAHFAPQIDAADMQCAYRFRRWESSWIVVKKDVHRAHVC